MKTIKERAEKFANENYTLDEAYFACEDGYIQGATDQKKIDIDKAYEFWYNALVKDKDPYKSVWLALVNTFKREMTAISCDLLKVERKENQNEND